LLINTRHWLELESAAEQSYAQYEHRWADVVTLAREIFPRLDPARQEQWMQHKPDHVVRLTGDCPLIDPEIIDQIVEKHIEGGYDYTSNAVKRTYPDGLDVEVVTFETLERAWKEAKDTESREHVTPYIYDESNNFKLGHVVHDPDLGALRWTVDYREDYDLVSAVYDALYSGDHIFLMNDILDYLTGRPELNRVNEKFWPQPL